MATDRAWTLGREYVSDRARSVGATPGTGVSDAALVEMIETMTFTTAQAKIVDALAIDVDP